MIVLRFLISITVLLRLCTTTLFLNAQNTLINDVVEFDCKHTITQIRDTWKPVKDSVYRYSPFNYYIKELNRVFLGQIQSIKYICPQSEITIKNLSALFPKPDVTIKTDSLIKQYYFFRNKEFCNYKSKKLNLSDNIPYTVILIFNKKTNLLVDTITN